MFACFVAWAWLLRRLVAWLPCGVARVVLYMCGCSLVHVGLFCGLAFCLLRDVCVCVCVRARVCACFLSLLYESPGGNQVDGLPPVLHSLPKEL